jgi:AraC-like DNA-binding protein
MSRLTDPLSAPREIELPAPILSLEAAGRAADRHGMPDAPADASRAVPFVAAHFHEKFPASIVAQHCGLSRFQFSRAFHATFGITFREYLLRYRIRAACQRLQGRSDSVTAVAYAVGFHDGSYFARMFRRYTGMLPSQYARWHDGHLPAPPPDRP